MKLHRGLISVQSELNHPNFHDITNQVKDILRESGVKDGICVVYSQHTTCSVMTQECSHDKTFWGLEYLQQDLVEIMDRLVPRCTTEGQYHHPGPKHIDFAQKVAGEDPKYSLNTEAHLRSVIFGRSETIVVAEGKLQMGEFGYIYFVDWDQLRPRPRICQIQIMGE